MPSRKDTKSRILATVDAAVTILEKYPDLTTTDEGLSVNLSANPFELIVDLFKHTKGANAILEVIGDIIVPILPVLELSTKEVILNYLKKFLSCSINPIITDEILRDGVVFGLRDIDLTDKLFEYPLSNVGKCYYFGCNGMTTPEEVKTSKDFDCLLWYMKNKSSKREVWGRSSKVGAAERDGQTAKQKKKDGIITLEYAAHSSGLVNAEGGNLNCQTPYSDCLHVMIGNAMEVGSGSTSYEQSIASLTPVITLAHELQETVGNYISQVEKERDDLVERAQRGYYKTEYVEEFYQEYEEQLDALNYWLNDTGETHTSTDPFYYLTQLQDIRDKILYTIVENFTQYQSNEEEWTEKYSTIGNILKTANSLYNSYQIELYNATHSEQNYRSIKYNYYYRHPLIEFNTDYIYSLRLFDAKVIAAQLLDQLTGLLSIDLNISVKRQIIAEEVRKMVSMVVESDDTIVNDCFFSFSNEEFDAMLNKAELTKAGLYSDNGQALVSSQIDAESLLEQLNSISDDASEEEIQHIIEGTFSDLSKEITSEEESKTKINANVSFNFIERLLNNLAMVLVMSVISPKLYLILKVNLEIVGQSSNFSLTEFIDIFKQMLVGLIREVRDILLQFLEAELLKIVGDLAKLLGSKIRAEQLAYYMRLLELLLKAWKKKSNSYKEWDMDNVNYADIYGDEDESEPADAGC